MLVNMILLSGGSGQRLWPLSNSVRSKQFLKLLKNEAGEMESMIQRVYQQIRQVNSDAKIAIATSLSQVESVRTQLDDGVNIVVEPERRDTFPAIALAVAYLHYKRSVALDEVVVVMPVDPYTEDLYFHKIMALNQMMQTSEANLGLLGITPTYPSSKYGYILRDGDNIIGFKEKPSEAEAQRLIGQGALWNGGVFVFKVKYLLEILANYIQFNSYEEVLDQYQKLPKNSFDYEVSEQESKLAMVEYSGSWKDLGTWKTLTEEIDSQTMGKVIMSPSSKQTHVINELDIPLTVIGAQNLVIAASPDGILVSDKIESAQLKKYLPQKEQVPMYKESNWGNKKILDLHDGQADTYSTTSLYNINPNHSIDLENPHQAEGSITIIEGTGSVEISGQSYDFHKVSHFDFDAGDSVKIHSRQAVKLLELLFIEE